MGSFQVSEVSEKEDGVEERRGEETSMGTSGACDDDESLNACLGVSGVLGV